MLSKPSSSSSGGSSNSVSISSPSKSRMAFPYSTRLRRWTAKRRRLGAVAGARFERSLEPGRQGCVRGLGRPRPAGRRHRPNAKFPHHFFPVFRVLAHTLEVHLTKDQSSRSEAFVVAGNAVLVKQRSVGRDRLRDGARGGHLRACCQSTGVLQPGPVQTRRSRPARWRHSPRRRLSAATTITSPGHLQNSVTHRTIFSSSRQSSGIFPRLFFALMSPPFSTSN